MVPGDEVASSETDNSSDALHTLTPSSTSPTSHDDTAADEDTTPGKRRRVWRHLLGKAAKIVGGVVVVYAVQQALGFHFVIPFQSESKNQQPATASTQLSRERPPVVSKAGGIPLAEVVRYRERQWFKDELEAARLGDTGSMIRLAKLHLAGAGCSKDIEAARYWVRKARKGGAWVSLEELIFDGPDPPPLPQGVSKEELLTAHASWQQPSYPAPSAALAAYSR